MGNEFFLFFCCIIIISLIFPFAFVDFTVTYLIKVALRVGQSHVIRRKQSQNCEY